MRFISRLIAVLLLVAVVLEGAGLYLGYQRQQLLQTRVTMLEQQTTELNKQLEQQQATIVSMQKNSAGALVKRANKVIVDGWGAIINSVDSELTRTRAALKQLSDERAQQP